MSQSDPRTVLADPDWDRLLLPRPGDDADLTAAKSRLLHARLAALGRAPRVTGLPTVAFCGHGRAGKDTAAMFLARVSPLRYAGSMSWWGKAYVAARLGISEQEAWDTRHQRRLEWKRLLNEYRAGDPTRLVRDTLAHGDIVPGVREAYEIVEGKRQGLLTHVVWVVNPQVPADPTVLYGPEACDVSVCNDDTVEGFHGRLLALFRALNIPLLS